MSEDFQASGGVGTAYKRATSGEATGTHGSEFMRTNITTIASKTRFLADDGTTAQESVLTPSYVNSWTDFGGTQTLGGYYKGRDGRVYLQGCIKSGTVPSSVFTLPAGYRPAATVAFAVESNGSHGVVSIASTGIVTVSTGNNTAVHLNGISFRAA